MVNWQLMKHPVNWIIVILMLAIAGAAGHLVLAHFGAEPSDAGLREAPASAMDRVATRGEYAAAVLQ